MVDCVVMVAPTPSSSRGARGIVVRGVEKQFGGERVLGRWIWRRRPAR